MPHPIYIMAAVTTVLALAVFGTLLWQITPRDGRRSAVGLLLALGCVMSPAAYYLVRVPLLITLLDPVLAGPGWDAPGWSQLRDAIRLAYAPITEEPVKLLPWVLLLEAGAPLWPARRMIAPVALSAGLGFAIGEIWLLAWLLAQGNDPKLAGLPWYAFGGFLSERLMTCGAHALFALCPVTLSRKGWKYGLLGLFLGMLLHGLTNAPILLLRREVFGWKPEVWSVLIQVFLTGVFIISLVALIAAAYGQRMVRRILANQMICPACGATYRQPILGMNFGLSRYEPCGACHRWNWVSLKNLAPLKPRRAPAEESNQSAAPLVE
jgi:hypothetical protein